MRKETLLKDKYKIPVGFCPKCEARIAYSDDGADKNHVRVECVDENYKGVTIMCHRCKSMLRVIEIQPPISLQFPVITGIQA